MTRSRAKAIHDKVNSLLSLHEFDVLVNGSLPHADTLCILRYDPSMDSQDVAKDVRDDGQEVSQGAKKKEEEERNQQQGPPDCPAETAGLSGAWKTCTRTPDTRRTVWQSDREPPDTRRTCPAPFCHFAGLSGKTETVRHQEPRRTVRWTTPDCPASEFCLSHATLPSLKRTAGLSGKQMPDCPVTCLRVGNGPQPMYLSSHLPHSCLAL